MVSRRNNENIKDIMLVGGALLLGYFVLKSQGLIKNEPPTSTATTPECPQGQEYTRGYFGDCAANYVATGWLQDRCTCLSKVQQ